MLTQYLCTLVDVKVSIYQQFESNSIRCCIPMNPTASVIQIKKILEVEHMALT